MYPRRLPRCVLRLIQSFQNISTSLRRISSTNRGPIKELISEKTRLSFVLNGALTSLPPQVLITSDPGGKDLASADWLVRNYAITVLPSVASLKILRTDKDVVVSPKPMIGFGDPLFNRTTQTASRKQQVAGFN